MAANQIDFDPSPYLRYLQIIDEKGDISYTPSFTYRWPPTDTDASGNDYWYRHHTTGGDYSSYDKTITLENPNMHPHTEQIERRLAALENDSKRETAKLLGILSDKVEAYKVVARQQQERIEELESERRDRIDNGPSEVIRTLEKKLEELEAQQEVRATTSALRDMTVADENDPLVEENSRLLERVETLQKQVAELEIKNFRLMKKKPWEYPYPNGVEPYVKPWKPWKPVTQPWIHDPYPGPTWEWRDLQNPKWNNPQWNNPVSVVSTTTTLTI